MGITLKRGRWIFIKRIPKRFQHVDPRTFARIPLKTDSRGEALIKAAAIEAELVAHWQALADGKAEAAATRYAAACRLAAAKGFSYIPVDDLATAPLDAILERVEAMRRPDGRPEPEAVRQALMGAVPRPPIPLSQVLAEYLDLTKDRLAGKTDRQIKRWRQPRDRAVRNFAAAIGDLAVDGITRDDALAFRTWWQDRVDGGLDPGSANKDFGHLSDIFGTWCEMKGRDLQNPFARLRFKERQAATRLPFSVEWIKTRLLAPGALDGLNSDARDAFLVMINTGARPSEIIGARPADFRVSAEIPHLSITAHAGRTLKTDHSARDIPLLGVSRAAAVRLAAAGGCSRYLSKPDSWSAAVAKYLSQNGLRESPAHTAYSLRHSFEDRLLEVGVDERLRIELMGHRYHRPSYGRGGSLEIKRDAIARIAL